MNDDKFPKICFSLKEVKEQKTQTLTCFMKECIFQKINLL